MSQEQFAIHMKNGFEAMLQAGNEENKSHLGIRELAQAMHNYWEIAIDNFSEAARVIPTANVEWATAVEMMLLARKMQRTHKIPQ